MTQPKGYDLTKGYLPLVFVFGMFFAVGTVCVKVGQTIARYEVRESEVLMLSKQVAELTRIVSDLRPGERWTRSDQVLFCWEAERANPSWRCPAMKPSTLEEKK